MGLYFRSSSIANTGNTNTVSTSSLSYDKVDGNFSYLLTNMSGSNLNFTGSMKVTGSMVMTGSLSLNANINLQKQSSLSSGTTGSLAVSGSHLYFNDGTTWTQVI